MTPITTDKTSAVASGGRPSAARAWWMASRPRTLGAGAVPVLVGLALAGRRGPLDPSVAAMTLVAALLLQTVANLANDYFDWARGVDTADRLGPVRVTQAGIVSPRAMRTALFTVLTAALLVGAYLVWIGGLPIALIGVAAMAAALAYSAGPFPLASHALGEFLVLLFFGAAAVGGTYWLQRGAIDAGVLLASIPPTCPAVALIVVNNLRDIDTDRAAGKRTVAVRIGARATRWEYTALIAATFVGALLTAFGLAAGAALTLLAAPLGAREVIGVWRAEGAMLNRSLAGTARLHVVAGVLSSIGLSL